MTKELLTHLSCNFCVNCCGDTKKLDCDTRQVICDKLANFLMACQAYKGPDKTLTLGELIPTLTKYGNQFASWYQVNTNVESAELIGNNQNGYKVMIKVE